MATIFKQLRSLAVVTAVLACVSASAPEGNQRSAQPVKLEGKMVCVGASITAGEGVKPEECYVALLGAKAKAANLNLEVVGQGRSGWSTGAYLANKDKIVDAMPADATIVTFLLGINDSRDEGTPREVGKRAGDNLAKLIDLYHAKAPGAQFVILSPTKAFPAILTKRLLDAHYGEDTPVRLRAISKAFKKLAVEREFMFIDLSDVPSSEKTASMAFI